MNIFKERKALSSPHTNVRSLDVEHPESNDTTHQRMLS